MPPDLEAYRRAARLLFYRKADLDAPDASLQALAGRRRDAGEALRVLVAAEAAHVLGLPESTAELVEGGTLHAVFRVRATGGLWYARTSLPGLGPPAGELLVDQIASATAAAAGVPVARVRHADLTRTRVPFDLEILDAAHGGPIAPGPEGDPARRGLGSVLATLHQVRAPGWGPLDPSGAAPRGLRESWRDFVLQNLEAHLDACRTDGTLLAAETETVRAAIRDAEPVLASAPGVLCHGDLATPNVLADGDTVTALLDWEDALVGDPLFDLAGWGTFVGHHDRRASVLAGYAAHTPLPADAELRYCLYFVRIMIAKTVHRRRFGYAATDRIPAGDRIRPALAALGAELGRGT